MPPTPDRGRADPRWLGCAPPRQRSAHPSRADAVCRGRGGRRIDLPSAADLAQGLIRSDRSARTKQSDRKHNQLKGESMGQPVVHFEVISNDPDGLRKFFGELFDWQFGEPMGPTDYTMVERNTNDEGVGIAGGVGSVPEGYDGHVTIY